MTTSFSPKSQRSLMAHPINARCANPLGRCSMLNACTQNLGVVRQEFAVPALNFKAECSHDLLDHHVLKVSVYSLKLNKPATLFKGWGLPLHRQAVRGFLTQNLFPQYPQQFWHHLQLLMQFGMVWHAAGEVISLLCSQLGEGGCYMKAGARLAASSCPPLQSLHASRQASFPPLSEGGLITSRRYNN